MYNSATFFVLTEPAGPLSVNDDSATREAPVAEEGEGDLNRVYLFPENAPYFKEPQDPSDPIYLECVFVGRGNAEIDWYIDGEKVSEKLAIL